MCTKNIDYCFGLTKLNNARYTKQVLENRQLFLRTSKFSKNFDLPNNKTLLKLNLLSPPVNFLVFKKLLFD